MVDAREGMVQILYTTAPPADDIPGTGEGLAGKSEALSGDNGDPAGAVSGHPEGVRRIMRLNRSAGDWSRRDGFCGA